MTFRAQYWSCTKFADWIRGTKKPDAETSSGWKIWRKNAESTHKVRYWIAEKGLDKIQNFIHWPTDKLRDIKYYLFNRYVTRTHALTSNLSRGSWHEFEERILYSCFDELVNFVEIDLANSYIAWNSEIKKKYRVPRYGRSAEAGIEQLRWATNLTIEFGAGKGEPSHQALIAHETLILYQWWKHIRPNRPDPYFESGWADWCEYERKKGNGILSSYSTLTPQERKQYDTAYVKLQEIEAAYDQEDEKMLIRLIKIRKGLWT